MKRVLVLATATSLAGCSWLGIGGSDDQAVTLSALSGDAATQDAATEQATVSADAVGGVKSITPPQSRSTLAVADAWASVSPKGSKVAAGYFIVANGGIENDKLVSVTSPRAGKIELHEISVDGKVAKMRPLASGVDVPPGGSAMLQEDGIHVMFMNVDTPFTEGETIPVTLTFEKAGNVDITMKVRRGGHAVAQQ